MQLSLTGACLAEEVSDMDNERVVVTIVICMMAVASTILVVNCLFRHRRLKESPSLVIWIYYGSTIVLSISSVPVSLLICIMYGGNPDGTSVRYLLILFMLQSVVYLPFRWLIMVLRKRELLLIVEQDRNGCSSP